MIRIDGADPAHLDPLLDDILRQVSDLCRYEWRLYYEFMAYGAITSISADWNNSIGALSISAEAPTGVLLPCDKLIGFFDGIYRFIHVNLIGRCGDSFVRIRCLDGWYWLVESDDTAFLTRCKTNLPNAFDAAPEDRPYD